MVKVTVSQNKIKPSIWKKKIKYSMICFGVFFGGLTLIRLVFGTGDVTAVLFVLPLMPFFFGGMMIPAGIFDDLLTEDKQED